MLWVSDQGIAANSVYSIVYIFTNSLTPWLEPAGILRVANIHGEVVKVETQGIKMSKICIFDRRVTLDPWIEMFIDYRMDGQIQGYLLE